MLRPVAVPDGGLTREWAFDGASGADIDVVVIDSGIDAGHPAVGAVAGGVALSWDPEDERVIVTARRRAGVRSYPTHSRICACLSANVLRFF